MRKSFLAIAFVLLFAKTYADEGMWIPMLLGEQVYKDMVKKGLKLKADQLYSINHSSLKDAIIIFGGGCTGEIVSDKGLIFTNHHCGYDAIATASTVEHNYLHDGFWAADPSKEIPSKITVRFLNRIEDVTKKVMEALGNSEGMERAQKLINIQSAIVKETTAGDEFKAAVVASMFKGNQYFLYVYDVYRDVRLVGNPPESIGKFGGDTDNWEWPRHTGDFSVFRVYMSADGKPANYNKNNVALKPKYFLPVSLKGFKDGDYSMIFGYPGGTNRYETSFGVELSTSINNPTLVKLREMRLQYMFEEMKKDPAVKLQLASSYASIANYWKFYDGETKQLLKYDIYGQKKKAEADFISWAKGKTEYENIFSDYEKNYMAWKPYAMHAMYMREGIMGSPLLAYAAGWGSLEQLLMKKEASQEEITKAITAATEARENFLKEENKKSDQEILASVMMLYNTDIPREQQPQGFYDELFKKFNSIEESPYKRFAADVVENTMAFDAAKWNAFTAHPTVEALEKDPAYATVMAFLRNWNNNYASKNMAFINKNNDLGRLYMKGLFEMNPAKMKGTYPDANFTMRVTYGNVKSYKPKDAVTYDYACTLSGVMAKYIP
ncbi:MAG: S46 family peptidase, partial [Bacteroidota bacterium]|nr:S46 family peptidase [Bacteroidota bacterium]